MSREKFEAKHAPHELVIFDAEINCYVPRHEPCATWVLQSADRTSHAWQAWQTCASESAAEIAALKRRQTVTAEIGPSRESQAAEIAALRAELAGAKELSEEHELAIFLRNKLDGCKAEGRSTYAISIYQLEELLDEYRAVLSAAKLKASDGESLPIPLLIRGRRTT